MMSSVDEFKKRIQVIVDGFEQSTKSELRYYFESSQNMRTLESENEEFIKADILCQDQNNIKFIVGEYNLKVKNRMKPFTPDHYIRKYDRYQGPSYFINVATFYFTFSKDLHEILGLDPKKFPNVRYNEAEDKYEKDEINSFAPKFKINIDEEKNQEQIKESDMYFVYCDIIQESFVKNIKQNILRIFNKKKQSQEDNVCYSFNDNLYIPLRVDEINSIMITIRNEFGDILRFDRGKIFVTLLMRPIEYI